MVVLAEFNFGHTPLAGCFDPSLLVPATCANTGSPGFFPSLASSQGMQGQGMRTLGVCENYGVNIFNSRNGRQHIHLPAIDGIKQERHSSAFN